MVPKNNRDLSKMRPNREPLRTKDGNCLLYPKKSLIEDP